MAKKSAQNTRGKLVAAAWKLFYEQGYDNTTVEDIIAESGASKGSFYHYFDGKDALLSSLSYLFDEKYEELEPLLESQPNCQSALLYLNQELFTMVENSVSMEVLARLLSSQLITRGDKHLLDRERTYYKLLRRLVGESYRKGELAPGVTVTEVVKAYAMAERALMYDWCLSQGEYSLTQYSQKMMPHFMQAFWK